MSWLYSQALVAEYLGENCSDGEQFAQLSKTNMQLAYLPPDKMTEFSRLSRFGMTFAPLTENLGLELLTLFLADSHAKTLALQEKGQELQVSEVDCGQKWSGLLAKFDPVSCSLKIPQCSLFGEEQESLATLPRSGILQNGCVYQLQIVERHTSETDSGLWPTPTVCGNYNRKGASKTSGDGLATMVKKFPTPTAHMAKETNAPSEANRNQPSLTSIVGGKLNPEWVEWLMNWPINWSSINEFNKDEFKRWKKESAESIQESGALRTMWWDFDPSQASHRPRYNEQQKAEHFNPMPEMPRVYTCEGKMERPHQGQDLFILRDPIYIRESKGEDLLEGVREQIGLDEKKIIQRVTDKSLARVDRLTALGNGQVPRVAATAFNFLKV